MKIYTEQSLSNFEFWSGASVRADIIKEKLGYDAFDTIENELEMDYPEGMSDTQINDLFWFEEDYIARMLGYRNWEHLEKGDDPITIICKGIKWLQEDLPESVVIVLDNENDIGDYLEAKEMGEDTEFVVEYLEYEYDGDVDKISLIEEGDE